MIVSARHSWESPLIEIKNKIKTTKKIRKAIPTKKSQTFIACSEYCKNNTTILNNEEWALYFEKCGNGTLPKGFFITGADLVSNTKRAGDRISLSMETNEQCKQLIDFFKRNDKTLNIVEKLVKKQNIPDPDSLQWHKRSISAKYKLILLYIQDKYADMDIVDIDLINNCYSKTIDMIEFRGLNIKNITTNMGKIDSFPSINITKDGPVGVYFKTEKIIDYGFCDDFTKPVVIIED